MYLSILDPISLCRACSERNVYGWFNYENAFGEYLLISQDGKKTSIDQTWYDKAMRWVDPDWWEKHPNGGKDSLNFEDALKAIMKATGAKMDKKDKDKKEMNRKMYK